MLVAWRSLCRRVGQGGAFSLSETNASRGFRVIGGTPRPSQATASVSASHCHPVTQSRRCPVLCPWHVQLRYHCLHPHPEPRPPCDCRYTPCLREHTGHRPRVHLPRRDPRRPIPCCRAPATRTPRGRLPRPSAPGPHPMPGEQSPARPPSPHRLRWCRRGGSCLGMSRPQSRPRLAAGWAPRREAWRGGRSGQVRRKWGHICRGSARAMVLSGLGPRASLRP